MPKSVMLQPPPDLGFGVVSRNTVDAAIAVAYRYSRRLMLVASRAQIDRKALGAGYVEGWTMDDLVGYVRSRDADRRIIVCRDHGGPWQHPSEIAGGVDEDEAMASSLATFHADIAAGVELLHIDTSRDRCGPATLDASVHRMVTLYAGCHEFARRDGRTVFFEVGFDEQSVDVDNPGELRDVLGYVNDRRPRTAAYSPARRTRSGTSCDS